MSRTGVLQSITGGLNKSTYEVLRFLPRLLHRMSKFAYSKAAIELPDELTSVADVYVSDKHKYLADKYGGTIAGFFDNDENCRPTNNGVRKQVIDKSFIWADIEELAQRYGARIDELTIFRLQQTDRESDRGRIKPTEDGWISELWHSDNDRPGQFKIIIYLTNVTELSAPFEYKEPVTYLPFDRRPKNRNRIPYEGGGKKVTGPRGTSLIFKNNIIHKGNYCRQGHRDVIMIGLEIPGRMTRLGDFLRKAANSDVWVKGG